MGGGACQFSTPVNIQMSLYSIPFYASFEDRLGYPCDTVLRATFFARPTRSICLLRANYESSRHGWKNVRLVAGDEIAASSATPRDDIVAAVSAPRRLCRSYSAMIGFMTWASDTVPRLEERERNWNYANVSGNAIITTRPSTSRPRATGFHAHGRQLPLEHGLHRSRRWGHRLPVEPCAACWFRPTFDQFPHTRP